MMEYLGMKNIGQRIEREQEMGFSIIELLITLTIISIMSGAVAFYLNSTQKLYKADDVALTIIDVMQEARQRSLTQRETMRVEIDRTKNAIELIDENSPTTATDDVLIRRVSLPDPSVITIGEKPLEIANNPPEPFPVPTTNFKLSSYPTSNAHQVATIRFQSSGAIVDAGNNPTGAGALNVGSTLHVWTKSDPQSQSTESFLVARAITTIGTTGSIRLWEFNPKSDVSGKWEDSRLTGSYGGHTNGGTAGSPTP